MPCGHLAAEVRVLFGSIGQPKEQWDLTCRLTPPFPNFRDFWTKPKIVWILMFLGDQPQNQQHIDADLVIQIP
jgi:hypothetical protein